MEEQGAFNTKVAGSSPATPTIQQIRDEVAALWWACNPNTSHGRAQMIAYDRVQRVIEGKDTGVNFEAVFK